MRIAFLVIGSLLTILLFCLMFAGKKYWSMLEGLDEKYPLKDLYCVGLCWMRLVPLKGKMRATLVSQAKLLFDPKYAEYYATIVWAQMLSFVHLGIMAGFILGGATNSILFVLVGLVVAGVFGYYFLNHMNELLHDREAACTEELPEIVSTMALLINSGMTLREGWRTVADSKEGTVYELMQNACVDMDNGMSEADAIYKFGRLTNSTEVRKFTSALVQGLERGSGDISNFLNQQSTEMWGLKKQLLLQKGEKAASKLLAPTAIIFIGIIIVVIVGAIGMLI